MLIELRVNNFAIINSAEVYFEKGLNVLTGETGAGKSLLVDALLIFFYRGGAEYIRSGEEKAIIEVVFELDEEIPDFEEIGDDGVVVLKKIIHKDGKSKNYINGSFTTQTKLTELLKKFLHIYGQSEERELYNSEYHLEMFDLYCGVNEIKERLSQLIKKGREIRNNLDEILSKERDREKEIDYLTFQIDEIEKAMLNDDNEEEFLKQKKEIFQVREKIINTLSKVYQYLYEGDESVFDKISLSVKMLSDIPLEGTELDKIANELDIRKEDVKIFSIDIKNFIEKITEEESNLEEIEERLNLIFKLKKKYGGNISDIKKYLIQIKERLEVLKNIDIYKEDIERKLEEIRKEISKEMRVLSQKRMEKKGDFEKKIIDELKDLGMEKADFEVKIKKIPFDFPENMPEKGDENIEFYFSAHKSEDKKPLNKIASGGELSRIMLAIKNVIPKEKKRTFIFDEVDSGVGGLTAEMIGRKLKDISKRHQVLCITHLPQVAVFADNHITVEKKEINGRINVVIKPVKGEDRIAEITRMLGGDIKSKGRDYALELLKKGESID